MENNLPIFNVSELVDVVNQTLDVAYPSVLVEGEVESFKVNQNKFVFFNLKDGDTSISCFMMLFSLRIPLEDGMKIIVRARPKLTKWSKFSLTIEAIKPSGEGTIKKGFELLKQKLEQEGLFAVERKRQLPRIPRTVGVIASVESAGYADFMKIANERFGGVNFLVYHTQVQGIDAPDQLIAGVKYFNELAELPDVLVLIRGGGSSDDLAAYNDELLVREIATSRIPTLVGVGHEVDTTLADLVADVRAATPSNAAQMLLPDRQEFKQRTQSIQRTLESKLVTILTERSQYIQHLLDNVLIGLDEKLKNYEQMVSLQQKILSSYNPESVLEKGYAVVRGTVKTGSVLDIETAKYNITAEVQSYEQKH